MLLRGTADKAHSRNAVGSAQGRGEPAAKLSHLSTGIAPEGLV
jgi:hypothetical protein